ncbi:MAG: DUF4013 domain-containing protein [Natrialbaceae archaeon]|nr:DUF4013 domain-containing protein [Natrialbaceae archaeon]
MAYCPSCDVTRDEGQFCAECGTELIQPDESAPSDPDPHEAYGLFEFSLRYPFASGLGPTVLGAGLTLLSILILPYFMLLGYGFQLGRASARGDAEPPGAGDWTAMLRDGVLVVLAPLPIAILGFAVMGALWLVAMAAGDTLVVALVTGVIVLLYLVVAYIAGAILPVLIATGSVTACYRDLLVLRFALSKQYLVGFVVLLLVQLLIWTVIMTIVSMVSVVLILTFIGIILLLPLFIVTYLLALPYTLFVSDALWGYVCREAAEDGALPAVEEEDSLSATL